MRGAGPVIGNERGAVAVLVAVGVAAMLAFLALAIDLGMLFKAHVDAQRAADAAALAGASAFLESRPGDAVGPARARATEYAVRNTFLNGPIDPGEVSVQVIPDSFKVRVAVQRDTVGTWFARIFGVRSVPIGALAAAVAQPANAARCLKPFAVPDAWRDANGDRNGNREWDPGEVWRYGDSPGDSYLPYSGPHGSPNETGYGSGWRDGFTPYAGDYGRQIKIKVTDPNDLQQPEPGIFLPWRLPPDPNQKACTTGGSGGNTAGAATYRRNICSCNLNKIVLGADYDLQPGNMVGPTWQGVNELVNEDPNARWDAATNTVKGSKYSSWMDSPRVVRLALFDPSQITKSGKQTIRFNNYALMFIEQQAQMKDPITGRFLYYASGDASGPSTTGSLVKALRLVQ